MTIRNPVEWAADQLRMGSRAVAAGGRSIHLAGRPAIGAPTVRRITFADLGDAVRKGVDDFWVMPTHLIFLAIIYPLVGIFLARVTFGYGILPLLFPLAAGFALIGPFAAIGLYEVSRRREQGFDTTWHDPFRVLRCPSLDAIFAMGLILMILFLLWLVAALVLYRSLFDVASPDSIGAFVRQIFLTPQGWMLIVLGNGIGFVFAAVALAISVVSFPLLLDREVGVLTAIRTSVRAVYTNPVEMFAWGLFVAVLLVVGSLPLFAGLAIVMPVLAHATWHLYRTLVEH